MKINLLIRAISVIILGGISAFAISDVETNKNGKSFDKSYSSSSKPKDVSETPIITNEAEYAEFVKKNEKLNSSSPQKTSASVKNSANTISIRSSSAATQ